MFPNCDPAQNALNRVRNSRSKFKILMEEIVKFK